MRAIKLLAICFIGFSMLHCGSAKKAFEQGNYFDSVMRSVKKLRSNPDHKKSREVLRKSHPLAVKTLHNEAEQFISSTNQFKFRESLAKNELINQMATEIARSPGALSVIPRPKRVDAQVKQLKQQAANESYVIAEGYMSKGGRLDAKEAFYLYQDVNRWVPGYKDVRSRLEESHHIATLKVLVEQIPVPTSYSLSARFFQDKIEEHLHRQHSSNEFVRFYTAEEAKRIGLDEPDHYLRLAFDDFIVGNTFVEKTIENLSLDSVVVGSVTLEDGTEVDAYNTVTAKLTTFRKQVVSEGLFSMQVYDAYTNAVLKHDKFTGNFTWYSQWGSFNGDERALSAEQIKICNTHEAPPPPPQDMFIEFTRPIFGKLIPAMDGFYRQF